MLCLSLLGIYARPEGDWSAFWPANAVLLGMIVRIPGAASPAGWMGALIGYLAADLLTGGGVYAAGLLTAGNMSGVMVGAMFLLRLDPDDLFLRRPRAILLLALIAAFAAAVSGVVGGLAAHIFFDHSYIEGWLSWFLTELVNYVAILPMVLTVPALSSLRRMNLRGLSESVFDPARLAPAVALGLSFVAALMIGGPGAPSYPIPALLWCALTYSLFATACLTFLLTMWILISVLAGIMFVPAIAADPDALISIRLGVMMMALAPITVASAIYARQELLDKLRHLATRDPLTDLLNRKAFTDEAKACLADLDRRGRPVALAMIDLDRFKEINDSFGHTGGDEVLVAFARMVREEVRDGDSVARMGGEEFSLLLPDCDRRRAEAIAERIRGKVAGTAVHTSSGAVIHATVSIGLAVEDPAASSLEGLLYVADQALYRAKDAGRNRTEIS
ncbi:GGDEF domain-containing protein [Amorphus orientalis]|uniref:diguanylate cyclase n=1 Tax=Amorphus orientalis TaxID=649198 RepID=A0AAE3VQY5_9HYPH|nr:sensor domain-containing diguanylate cyclase [Amorphus orientalis]MDQ0316538.1 diguanylate cyclase (GGDEF)-like protein [Amorphus orientalis]